MIKPVFFVKLESNWCTQNQFKAPVTLKAFVTQIPTVALLWNEVNLVWHDWHATGILYEYQTYFLTTPQRNKIKILLTLH